MSVVMIMAPLIPVNVNAASVDSNGNTSANPSMSNVATPDPKEVGIVPANGGYTVVDYELPAIPGYATLVDSFFVGHHNAVRDDQRVVFLKLSQFGGGVQQDQTPILPLRPLWGGDDLVEPYITSYRLPQPWGVQYLRAMFYNPSGAYPFRVGLVSAGLSFQPVYGVEWGAGRPVIDTGRASRLPGGGFGIEEGAIVGGYQWTLGDIQPSELAKLYGLLRGRGTTKPVWVVEDPDQTAGLNERTHYGLFTKIETYERLDPRNTRIGLQMEDWA